MPVERRYATAYTNPGSWTNPDNVLGSPDNVCACKRIAAAGDYYLYVSTFGFSLPAGSTINSVRVGAYLWTSNNLSLGANTKVRLTRAATGESWETGTEGQIESGPCPDGSCTKRVELRTICLPGVEAWTLAEINGEQFTVTVILTIIVAGFCTGYADAAYVEVDYTPPAAAARAPMGDGLTWVQRVGDGMDKKFGLRGHLAQSPTLIQRFM